MWEFKQSTFRLPERARNGGNPSHHLIVNLMNASFNVTVMYNTALIAHGREGEGAPGMGMEGVGSETEKHKKRGCKKGTKVVSESKRCVVIQMVAKWRWGGRDMGMGWSSHPSIFCSFWKTTGWRWRCERHHQWSPGKHHHGF